jgi:hypothetical protein
VRWSGQTLGLLPTNMGPGPLGPSARCDSILSEPASRRFSMLDGGTASCQGYTTNCQGMATCWLLRKIFPV